MKEKKIKLVLEARKYVWFGFATIDDIYPSYNLANLN